MSHTFKTIVAAAVMTMGASLATPAQASGCYEPPAYHLKTVTVYDYVRQPYAYYVTQYDHCGQPYRVRQVTWRTVRVPVQKTIRVWH